MCLHVASSAQDNEQEAIDDYYYQGKDHFYAGDYNDALLDFLKSLELSHMGSEVSNGRLFKLYYRLGRTYAKLRYQQKALLYLDSALVHARNWHGKDHVNIADAHMYKGVVYSQLLQLEASAAENYKALRIYESLYGKESREVASMYMHMGVNYYKQDEFEISEKCYLKAKAIFDRTLEKGDQNWNRIYNNMGMLYRKKKNYTKALNYARIALEYKLDNYPPDHPSVAKYYSNLFRVYRDMGELDKAVFYNEKQLEVARSRHGKDHPLYASALAEHANIQYNLGHPKKAYELFKESQDIHRKRLDPNHPYALSGYSNRAMCLHALGDVDGAIRLVRLSMKGNQAYDETYFPHIFDDGIYLASLYKEKGDFKQAQHMCDSLLGVLLQLTSDNKAMGFTSEYDLLHIKGLHERAHIKYLWSENRDVKIIDSAVQDFAKAIALVERVQRGIPTSETETYFFDQSTGLFHDAILAAIALNRATQKEDPLILALQWSEKSKAALLRRSLNEGNARIQSNIPSELIETLDKLEKDILDAQDELNLYSFVHKAGVKSQSIQQLVDLQESRDSFLLSLEYSFPEYYHLKYGDDSLNINKLRAKLKDEKQACISYFLSDSIGYGFFVSQDTIGLFSYILSEEEIEWIEQLQSGNVVSTVQGFNDEMGENLYTKLWRSAETILSRNSIRRVVVSPHLELNYLPLDLLRDSDGKWVIENYALSYTNSLMLRNYKRGNTINENWNYAGFAPVFDFEDSSTDYLVSRDEISPLLATVQEVEKSSELFNGKVFIRESATQKSFVEACSQSNIIHVASHAAIEPDAMLQSGIYLFPDTSEASVLSKSKLTISEIYNLDLNSDLVILSACHTGGGDLSESEGPMSMSRAFQYAGSNSVVMSHWRANDESTANIVVAFMQNLEAGLPKDVALQRAKKSYLKQADPLMAHPFFWASLSLYGEANKLIIHNVPGVLDYGLALVGVLFLLGWLWISFRPTKTT